jgi:hypothetical protein
VDIKRFCHANQGIPIWPGKNTTSNIPIWRRKIGRIDFGPVEITAQPKSMALKKKSRNNTENHGMNEEKSILPWPVFCGD